MFSRGYELHCISSHHLSCYPNMALTAVGDQFILGVSLTGLIVGALLAAVMTNRTSSDETDTGLPPISVHVLTEVQHGR
jgi:hypothetical protein